MELHPVSRTPVSSSAAGLDSESSEDDEESKWERKPRRESHQTYSFWLVAIGGVYLLYRTMGCIYHYWFYIWSILISFSFRTNSLLGIVTTIMGISMLNLRLWWIPFVWSWRVFFVFVFVCIYIYTYWNLIKMGSIWTTDQNQDVFYMKNWSKLYVFPLVPWSSSVPCWFSGWKTVRLAGVVNWLVVSVDTSLDCHLL